MQELKIHLRELELTKSGTVEGMIYVQLGDVRFPDGEWYDLPASVLDMWVDAASTDLGSERYRKCTLPFMDGPCRIQLERTKAGSPEVDVFLEWDGKNSVYGGRVDFPEFVRTPWAAGPWVRAF